MFVDIFLVLEAMPPIDLSVLCQRQRCSRDATLLTYEKKITQAMLPIYFSCARNKRQSRCQIIITHLSKEDHTGRCHLFILFICLVLETRGRRDATLLTYEKQIILGDATYICLLRETRGSKDATLLTYGKKIILGDATY